MNDLPERAKNILDTLRDFRSQDAPTHGGRVFSYVYDPDNAVIDHLAEQAISQMQAVNGLNPTVFTSVARIEHELLQFMKEIFHANANNSGDTSEIGSTIDPKTSVWGNATSGGTESCLLAVKAARDYWHLRHDTDGARSKRLNIVATSTVHAAFHKAAQYFGLELKLVPIDPETKRVDSQHIIEEIDDLTALVVLSAPNYPHGVIDPIEEVAAYTVDRDISLHVDACFGGLVLPWWQSCDELWDFRIPGVTSISADLHKYGYAPKGVSVLLQRGIERHRSGSFALKSWPGYPVVNPTLLGSKSAGPLAAAWAITEYLGSEGFQKKTETIEQTTKEIETYIKSSVPGLKTCENTTGPVVVLETNTAVEEAEQIDPHILSDVLEQQFGWSTQQQPGLTQRDGSILPKTLHLTITPVTARVMDEFLADLSAAAAQVAGLSLPDPELMLQTLPEKFQEIAKTVTSSQQLTKIFEKENISPIDALKSIISSFQSADEEDPSEVQTEKSSQSVLPENMAPLTALFEYLPEVVVQRILVEVLAQQTAGLL